MSDTEFIGLSVTAEFLDWEVRGQRYGTVNTPECFHRVTAHWPATLRAPHVVCEVAAGAESRIVAWLLTQRVRVSLADPDVVCTRTGLPDAEAIDPGALVAFAQAHADDLRPATARDYPPHFVGPLRRAARPPWHARLTAALRHWRARRTAPDPAFHPGTSPTHNAHHTT